MLSTFFVYVVNRDTPSIVQFLMNDVLYPGERVIDGELISILGKDIITMVKKGHFKRECHHKIFGQIQNAKQPSQSLIVYHSEQASEINTVRG